MEVYVSGALMGSVDLMEARLRYQRFADVLSTVDVRAYLPHAHTDPEHAADLTPAQIYRRDLHRLESCDAVVAFVDEPSLGVGAELALCAERKIPIIILHHTNARVSRFALGLIEASGGHIVRYEDLDHAAIVVGNILKELLGERIATRESA